MILDVLFTLQKLGTAGTNEPIYAGTLVFGLTGVSLFYLAFLSREMEAGLVLKAMSIVLIGLALLSTFWPMRPWPH